MQIRLSKLKPIVSVLISLYLVNSIYVIEMCVSLGNVFFKKDLERLFANRRDRLWKAKEVQRKAKELLGAWNLKRLRTCKELSKNRLTG